MKPRKILLWVAVGAFVLAATGCIEEPSEPRVVEQHESTATAETSATGEPKLTPLADLSIELERVADGFDQPLYVTGDGTGSGLLYVVEQSGRIWIVRDGQRSEAFLDYADKVSTGGERGLLGLAFPEEFAESGRFIVSYTDREGTSVLAYVTARDGVADRSTEEIFFTQEQPFSNHNGGMITFGPDGLLYFGLGDGGDAGDPQGNGQNPDTYLAKLLTFDLDAAEPTPEIRAMGLRNPWRYSFDRERDDLWIGDVGQNAWEEIDFVPARTPGMLNFGWDLYEGTHRYPQGDAVSPGEAEGFVWPIVEYDRQAGKSVTGGYVYRGSEQEALWGTYFYADYVDGRIWGLQRRADATAETRLLLDNDMQFSSFGEDDDGELYVVDYNGAVYRVVAR